MKNKINLGDIYSIEGNKGYVIIQLVSIAKNKNELDQIRISYKLYSEIPENLDSIFDDDYFYLQFTLKPALNKKLISFIGNLQLPIKFTLPRYRRSKDIFDNNKWDIIDLENDTVKVVENLSKEELSYSPDEFWSIPNIIDSIENGFRLEKWQ